MYFSDAFGWDYARQLDFMDDYWRDRRPLHSILGYSSTIIPCLISGAPPDRTGLWTEYYRDERPQSRLAQFLTSSKLLLTPVNMARLVVFRFARLRGNPAAHK